MTVAFKKADTEEFTFCKRRLLKSAASDVEEAELRMRKGAVKKASPGKITAKKFTTIKEAIGKGISF